MGLTNARSPAGKLPLTGQTVSSSTPQQNWHACVRRSVRTNLNMGFFSLYETRRTCSHGRVRPIVAILPCLLFLTCCYKAVYNAGHSILFPFLLFPLQFHWTASGMLRWLGMVSGHTLTCGFVLPNNHLETNRMQFGLIWHTE
jgi:hypothetical protein